MLWFNSYAVLLSYLWNIFASKIPKDGSNIFFPVESIYRYHMGYQEHVKFQGDLTQVKVQV